MPPKSDAIVRSAESLSAAVVSSATAATLRELQEQRLADMAGVQTLIDQWRSTQSLITTPELVESMKAAQGLRDVSKSVAEMMATSGLDASVRKLAESYRAQMRETTEALNIGSEWARQIRETMDVISTSTVFSDEIRRALAERQQLAGTFVVTDTFRAVLAEAEMLAENAEAEATRDTSAVFATLTDAQINALQIALLGAMAEIASNVAFFVGSRRFEMASHLLSVLVALMTVYHLTRAHAE